MVEQPCVCFCLFGSGAHFNSDCQGMLDVALESTATDVDHFVVWTQSGPGPLQNIVVAINWPMFLVVTFPLIVSFSFILPSSTQSCSIPHRLSKRWRSSTFCPPCLFLYSLCLIGIECWHLHSLPSVTWLPFHCETAYYYFSFFFSFPLLLGTFFTFPHWSYPVVLTCIGIVMASKMEYNHECV